MNKVTFFILMLMLTLFVCGYHASAQQGILENASISGSLQTDAQYYVPDKAMGITDSTLNGNVFGMNTSGELNYSVGNFRAGMRFEAYTPALKGFDTRAKGVGIPYFYASYSNKYIDATIGDFYEQFGCGFALRAYQEWNLGYDNAIRGAKVTLRPYKGIKVTGLTGYQRFFWNNYVNILNYDRGLVSGVDGDFNVNEIFDLQMKTQISFGGSFVSKHETGLSKTVSFVFDDSTQYYKLNLPENVATAAGRINVSHGGFGFYGEYAYKINNPSAYNTYIYRPGQALYLTASYSTKGFGVTLAAKRVDNMSFKSKMDASGSDQLDINFIPPLSKQHHYSLPSLYPYATQYNGEMSLKGNVLYSIPKKTKLGGKYGMSIELDYTIVYDIKKDSIQFNGVSMIDQPGTEGYTSPFFAVGDHCLYSDLNLTVTKKFSQKWKGVFSYIYLIYDKDRVEGHSIGEYGVVNAHVGLADVSWKIDNKNSLRCETQWLFTRQDNGNWGTLLFEYSFLPHWFVSVSDEYNYGNEDKDQRLHYYNVSGGYVYNSTRVTLSYGRQRDGLLCVGGVCRYVPAATGVSLSLSTSF